IQSIQARREEEAAVTDESVTCEPGWGQDKRRRAGTPVSPWAIHIDWCDACVGVLAFFQEPGVYRPGQAHHETASAPYDCEVRGPGFRAAGNSGCAQLGRTGVCIR